MIAEMAGKLLGSCNVFARSHSVSSWYDSRPRSTFAGAVFDFREERWFSSVSCSVSIEVYRWCRAGFGSIGRLGRCIYGLSALHVSDARSKGNSAGAANSCQVQQSKFEVPKCSRALACDTIGDNSVDGDQDGVICDPELDCGKCETGNGVSELCKYFLPEESALCSDNGQQRQVSKIPADDKGSSVMWNGNDDLQLLVETDPRIENTAEAVCKYMLLDTSSGSKNMTMATSRIADGNVEAEHSWWSFGDFIDKSLHLPNGFDKQVEVLFESLGCRVDSKELLLRVLVHRSYYDANMPVEIRDQKKLTHWDGSNSLGAREGLISGLTFSECHRRARLNLALIGDALIGLVTSMHLTHEHLFQPDVGEVTHRKQQLVCNSNLGRVWSTLGLEVFPLAYLSGSDRKGKEAQTNLFADTFEALIGALVVEKGLESTVKFVKGILPLLQGADQVRNPISLLQEQCLISHQITPTYKLIGIDHKDTPHQVFRVRVYVKGIRMATGMGTSQKYAKQDAAEKAMRKWPERFETVGKAG